MKEQRVEAVEKALSVLEAFSIERRTLSLSDIARETGLYKSTVLRLAFSLERYGYLKRGDDLQYRLGPALWRLGALYRRSFDMGETIRPTLRQLVEATGETASFYVLDQDERLCLYRENSSNPIRHHLEEGARLTVRVGAAGHVLAAYGLNDPKARSRLAGAGFAVSEGERNPHVGAIAAPLFDAAGQFHGALAVSGPKDRFDHVAREAAIPVLLETAASLARHL
ncbi:MAG: IclR family transcriptional regulator [Actinomycetota bacterium]